MLKRPVRARPSRIVARLLCLAMVLAELTMPWSASPAHAMTFDFGEAFEVNGSVTVDGVAIDRAGNTVLAGTFSGVVDFDPSHLSSSDTLTSTPDPSLGNQFSNDAFVAKLDAHGSLLWVGGLGGPGNDVVQGVAVDSAGNVYVAGLFSGVADFDPGASSHLLDSAHGPDFLVKLTSDGRFAWADGTGGPDVQTHVGLAVTDSGDVYLVGRFEGTVDFDPGTGTTQLSSPSRFTAFLLALTTDGGFRWVVPINASGTSTGIGVAVGSLGAYVTGTYQGTLFEGTRFARTSLGGDDIYVVLYSSLGTLRWSRSAGSPGTDFPSSIVTSRAGSLYVTGEFTGTATFETGVTNDVTLVNRGDSPTGFVMKLDGLNGFRWVTQLGGTGRGENALPAALATDPSDDNFDDVYVTGEFLGRVDFDPRPGDFTLDSNSQKVCAKS